MPRRSLIKNPTVPTYFTNRALCHLKLKKWSQVISDCRRAIELDVNLVKAHFFLGQALLEQENYDEALASLKRAYDLAKEQKLNFGDDIASTVRLAKKKRFSVAEERRISQEIELQSYLNNLILDDKKRQMKAAGKDPDEEELDKIELECDKRLSEVNSLFKEVDTRRKRVGHFDPVTRTDLKQEQLTPNLVMKEVIDAFITDNEWVVEEY
ncbi:STIP1-likey and U box-containing protein 1 [Stylophora pistillata]|uniref:RING-type E3 ubiquitin transferase n=1 Tax=Stylophora pistillata TaxID=50429 RepID=A0A2B4RTM4_STYPI|nr:STIP1-likey and U box-containing protein 1 [Stylophora pistillata]